MSNPNDGGPAFPHEGQSNYTGGMTLRDYFAAHAGEPPHEFRPLDPTGRGFQVETPVERRVRWSLAYADAMLAARAPKEKS